ncbi:MAG: HXXEE domain-containing protein [Cyanobacteria bacterium P01_F01_bin.13]
MNNSRISLASICLLFFMLWAPLGQYDFLVENWMKLGIYIAPFLFFMFFASRTQETESILYDVKLMSVLMLVAYIVHQYEEHWIDLFGNQYAFYGYINELFLSTLNVQNTGIMPLSPESIFVINTSLVWLVGIIAIWRSPKHLFPALTMAGITLVNAVSHIMAGIAKQSYNPGLLTAIIIFIPLAIVFYRNIFITVPTASIQVKVSIIWAILAHVIMVGGLLAANWFELFPEYIYFAALIIWSIIPAFLFNSSAQTIQSTELAN